MRGVIINSKKSLFFILSVLGCFSFFAPLAAYALEDDVILENKNEQGTNVFIIAANTITAGSGYTINTGAEVTFVAGNKITLGPEFTVNAGAAFHASIGYMSGYTVAENENWQGRHFVYNDLVITPGSLLTLLPGTEIVFLSEGDSAFEVQGTLTAGQNILFTSEDPSPGSWKGLTITGSANLIDVTIEYARQGVLAKAGSIVAINGCTLRNNLVGIHAYGGRPIILNSSIINNSWYGIKEDEEGSSAVTYTIFSGNGHNYYDENLSVISINRLNSQPGNWGNQEVEE